MVFTVPWQNPCRKHLEEMMIVKNSMESEKAKYYWTLRYLAKVHHKGSGNWFPRQTNAEIFLQNWNRNLVNLLNVCQLGRSAVIVLLSHRSMRHFLSQCSLGQCCSLQNLHGVFGYGLQCFWDQKELFWEHFCL